MSEWLFVIQIAAAVVTGYSEESFNSADSSSDQLHCVADTIAAAG